PLVRDAVRAWGLEPIEQPGVEADDLIATYAELAADAGARVTIATQDKDFYQLVRPGVSLYDRGSGSEGSPGYRAPRWIGRDEVVAKFGVEPEQVVDVQAIMGDAVDNVPGVHGIGEKGAADLIRHFGSLDALLADIDAIPKPQHRRAFLAPSRVKDGETAVHDALLSRRLVTLDRFLLPIVPPDELVVPVPDYDRVRAFRRDMGFENGREAA
ncbi:MAG TPA: 5'-3' exonuclease H3TH domain-containing protein, partial [Beijerinckiaceae bacterium]|nr:5'-3' exonuclease H3TH domain-containing protein [Beijerinckiaceae bacterium]